MKKRERIQREIEEKERTQGENKKKLNESNATAIKKRGERNVEEIINELPDQIVVVQEHLKTNKSLKDQEKLLDAKPQLEVKHATMRAEVDKKSRKVKS